VNTLGEHINKIYGYLERIEMNIRKIEEEVQMDITDNKKELETVKKTMITKSEFNEVLQKLYQTFKEFTPSESLREPPNTNTSPQSERKNEEV